MENHQKCNICEKPVLSTNPSKLTPNQLASMQIDQSDIQAGTLVSMAISTITFNNPADSADRPMWWVCKECQSTRLSAGISKRDALKILS